MIEWPPAQFDTSSIFFIYTQYLVKKIDHICRQWKKLAKSGKFLNPLFLVGG